MLSAEQTALKILVVDDEANLRKMLSTYFKTSGHSVVAVGDDQGAIAAVAHEQFDVAFVDLRLGSTSGSELISPLIARNPRLTVVIITAHAAIDSAVTTLKRGAVDYIPKPFGAPELNRIEAFLTDRMRAKRVGNVPRAGLTDISLDSNCGIMQDAIALVRQVASTDANILFRGESGTGKGVLARCIHEWSDRKQKAFATISCPALPSNLLESELFGHVKGAFTGAIRANLGRIAACDGGTLFLDEIGDLPLDLQPKLLRFVQDRQYESVGDSRTKEADVRLICATYVDLEQAVRTNRFREDLLYRINVIQIEVPPLRQRREDIIPLSHSFVSDMCRGRQILGFTDEAKSVLLNYTWPGNVRELRNVIERAVVLCGQTQIGLECLPSHIFPAHRASDLSLGDLVPLEQLEEIHIRKVISRSKSLEEAAWILKIDPATLWRRRKKYGI